MLSLSYWVASCITYLALRCKDFIVFTVWCVFRRLRCAQGYVASMIQGIST